MIRFRILGTGNAEDIVFAKKQARRLIAAGVDTFTRRLPNIVVRCVKVGVDYVVRIMPTAVAEFWGRQLDTADGPWRTLFIDATLARGAVFGADDVRAYASVATTRNESAEMRYTYDVTGSDSEGVIGTFTLNWPDKPGAQITLANRRAAILRLAAGASSRVYIHRWAFLFTPDFPRVYLERLDASFTKRDDGTYDVSYMLTDLTNQRPASGDMFTLAAPFENQHEYVCCASHDSSRLIVERTEAVGWNGSRVIYRHRYYEVSVPDGAWTFIHQFYDGDLPVLASEFSYKSDAGGGLRTYNAEAGSVWHVHTWGRQDAVSGAWGSMTTIKYKGTVYKNNTKIYEVASTHISSAGAAFVGDVVQDISRDHLFVTSADGRVLATAFLVKRRERDAQNRWDSQIADPPGEDEMVLVVSHPDHAAPIEISMMYPVSGTAHSPLVNASGTMVYQHTHTGTGRLIVFDNDENNVPRYRVFEIAAPPQDAYGGLEWFYMRAGLFSFYETSNGRSNNVGARFHNIAQDTNGVWTHMVSGPLLTPITKVPASETAALPFSEGNVLTESKAVASRWGVT